MFDSIPNSFTNNVPKDTIRQVFTNLQKAVKYASDRNDMDFLQNSILAQMSVWIQGGDDQAFLTTLIGWANEHGY